MFYSRKSRLALVCACLTAGLAAFYMFAHPRTLFARGSGGTRVLLIGIDAGSWDTLKRLMADGKLPNLTKLIDEGAAGHLDSILWKELKQGTKSYVSPIVWASIATGKMPNKHGIEDFTLPVPSDLIAHVVARQAQGYADISLPDLPHAEAKILMKIRTSGAPAGKRKIGVYINSTLLKELKIDKDWEVYEVALTPSDYQNTNRLSFYYEAAPEEIGQSIVDFNYIRLYDEFGEELLDLHFLRDIKLFGADWDIPKPEPYALSSSFHMRSKTVWQILSEHQRKVGVVGWWESWPAEPVNGYLISSHVGFQGARAENNTHWLDQIQHLTYPEDYLKQVESQLFFPSSLDDDIRKRFYEIGQCSCVGRTQDHIFRNYYWQDRFFEKLSLDLLKNKGPFDLFAVYFRGVDAAGHQFLGFQDNPDMLKDCTGCDASRIPQVVDRYYEYMDEVVGDLQKFADSNTVTMIVTDHGQFTGGTKGIHANNGFVILHGGPVKPHIMERARVLDVTPTILYLMGYPVAQDMDGEVLLEAFNPRYLEQHPVCYKSTYEVPGAAEKKEVALDEQTNREGQEELKALGYIQK